MNRWSNVKRQFFLVLERALIPALLLLFGFGALKWIERSSEVGLRTFIFLFPFISVIFIIPKFRILKSLVKDNKL
jgi:hypothetical protein